MSTILPEHILRLMSPEDRATLGRAGMTKAEAQAAGEARSEKELHKQIGNLLRLRGIEFIESRMDRKTTQKRGVPDFLFAIHGVAYAWECKTGDGKLTEAQANLLQTLSSPPNQWRVALIRSVDDALAELRRLNL